MRRANAASEEIGACGGEEGRVGAHGADEVALFEAQGGGSGTPDDRAEDGGVLLAIPNVPTLRSRTVPGRRTTPSSGRGEARGPSLSGEGSRRLGAALDILDFDRAVRSPGRFACRRGAGALLERALINFMLDVHTREQTVLESFRPLWRTARRSSAPDSFRSSRRSLRVAGTDYFLVPTAEVPVTNIVRDEILDAGTLP